MAQPVETRSPMLSWLYASLDWWYKCTGLSWDVQSRSIYDKHAHTFHNISNSHIPLYLSKQIFFPQHFLKFNFPKNSFENSEKKFKKKSPHIELEFPGSKNNTMTKRNFSKTKSTTSHKKKDLNNYLCKIPRTYVKKIFLCIFGVEMILCKDRQVQSSARGNRTCYEEDRKQKRERKFVFFDYQWVSLEVMIALSSTTAKRQNKGGIHFPLFVLLLIHCTAVHGKISDELKDRNYQVLMNINCEQVSVPYINVSVHECMHDDPKDMRVQSSPSELSHFFVFFLFLCIDLFSTPPNVSTCSIMGARISHHSTSQRSIFPPCNMGF